MMAEEKFYAVKVGRKPGIYTTWEECREQIDGFPNQKYKSFKTREEAEKFLESAEKEVAAVDECKVTPESMNRDISGRIATLGDDEALAFVDGKCDASGNVMAYGVVMITAGGVKERLRGTINPGSSNGSSGCSDFAAETQAVVEAVKKAVGSGKKKTTVYLDNEGIEKFAVHEWTPGNDLSRGFVSFMDDCKKKHGMEIGFIKVPSRSGIGFKEEAGSLAMVALLGKGYRTNKDGTLYFYGHTPDKWMSVIDEIKKENDGLDEEIETITTSEERQSDRTILRVSQAGDTVTISCYSNSGSSVQGNRSVLFQRLVSTAVDRLDDEQDVVDTLNMFHLISIEEGEVFAKFETVLPHYRHEDDVFRNELMQAVYNSMITGTMWDYVFLVQPVFRALEFYLHKVLGDEMGLMTTYKSGKGNMFGHYFSNKNGRFYFDPKKVKNQSFTALSGDKADYLDRLYNMYGNVRNVYSHWSAKTGANVSAKKAIITEIGVARTYIEQGLKLFDEYYVLFN